MAHPAPVRIKIKEPSTKRTARLFDVKGSRYAALTEAVASITKGAKLSRRRR